ncbi:MAG: DNA replication/repair protein RecF [Bacteriovoracaceae bacterium]|jgi:DNA replication and repair protein RecF|nr:DNA replication/repair protein RecF [Bacteriovoracaceae bacterium]
MSDYKISKMQLTNFRNLGGETISFSKGINCILGENGNGKTNLLEAIYFLINRKSFRKNAAFPQILSIDGENQEIYFSSTIENVNEDVVHSVSGKWNKDGGSWYIDGRPSKRKMPIGSILINPFDSFNFHSKPQFRRKLIDQLAGDLSKEFKKVLNRYQKSLIFRNGLLSKKPSKYLEQIKIISVELAEVSAQLTRMRLEFLNKLNEKVGETFKNIFSESHIMSLELETKCGGWKKEDFINKWEQDLQKDLILGFTKSGVHKDDFHFYMDGFNSFDYCSLGQQKMSFLSLIFSYVELFNEGVGHYPVLLIDDVSGELDKERWRKLVSFLERRSFQIFITTANEEFRRELARIPLAQKFHIKSGHISNETFI